MGCVKPNDNIWMDWLNRYAVPEEKMALQGIFHKTYDSKSTPSTTISSLAGNAIPVPLCSVVNQCMMAEFLPFL